MLSTLLAGSMLAALAQATAALPAWPGVKPAAAAAQNAGGAAPPEAYTSYLALPSQENVMLRGSLDADELIGGEVVGDAGGRIGLVTDLMVGPGGEVTHAAVDAGPVLGVGSWPVAVDLALLRRSDVGPRTFLLAVDRRELEGLPQYIRTGDRWQLNR